MTGIASSRLHNKLLEERLSLNSSVPQLFREVNGVQHRKRFERTTVRLIHEVHNLRATQAALEALQNVRAGMFFHVAASALQSDRLIRLIRVLEDGKDAASFWYLYRCEPKNVERELDIKRLRDFSRRIKRVRDKTFVHIDKQAGFDPETIYREVAITGDEIIWSIESVWKILNRLYRELFPGKGFASSDVSRDELKRLCQESLNIRGRKGDSP